MIGQHELVDGWWIWKERILEEKGLLYVSKNNQAPMNSSYQIIDQEALDREGLDRYSGDYGLTQTAKIDSCEVWPFRPTAPQWYLFYHQNRECMWGAM